MPKDAPDSSLWSKADAALGHVPRHMGVMLKKNFLLQVRYWRMTVSQIIIAPIFFLLLLWLLQTGADTASAVSNLHPTPYKLPAVQSCVKATSSHCISIVFTPNTSFTSQVMQTLSKNNLKRDSKNAIPYEDVLISDLSFKPSKDMGVVAVPSKEFLYQYVLQMPNITMFGVSFDVNDTKKTVSFQLWYNYTLTRNSSDPYGWPLVSFARAVNEAILTTLDSQNRSIDYDVSLKDFPDIASTNSATAIVKSYGPTFFMCCMIVHLFTTLNSVVAEKELKLRAAMEMMGLRPFVYWFSWLLTSSAVVFLSSIVTCGFGYAFGFPFFSNADFGVTLITFFLFGCSLITMGFFITTLVRKVGNAVNIGIFILILGLIFMRFIFSSTLIGYVWWDPSTDPLVWKILTIIPFFNFGKLVVDISQYAAGRSDPVTEISVPGVGFRWEDLYNDVPQDISLRTFSIPAPILSWYFLIMNIAEFWILTWYLDNVIPNEFGHSKPLWFFLLPSYWGYPLPIPHKMRIIEPEEDEDEDVKEERKRAQDPSSTGEVRIINLLKVFRKRLIGKSKDDKYAVNNLCLNLKENECLALLGQNGAGKSTTMNILCGFNQATAGNAIVYGYSIKRDLDMIRNIMGVCPQHDILFHDLTSYEHIELFAKLKNIPSHEIPDLAKERLEAVRLWNVRDKPAGAYSGGMKRRLSMAISTIGDPKILYLDEPTTGMDPLNRRHVWSFIQKFKTGRVIILTTHSMEEADVLGDRIAIMAYGKLRALGNSIRLKSRFGGGYRLSVVVANNKTDEVRAMVESNLSDASLEDDSAGALIYRVPASGEAVAQLARFVRTLEELAANYNTAEQKNDTAILSARLFKEWGISLTSLEEVFLRLVRKADKEEKEKDEKFKKD